MSKKILILAANPRGDLRNIDREIRDLKKAIARNKNSDDFEIETEVAVLPEDLQDLLYDNQPYIVHFCGHATSDNYLVFENEDRGEQKVSYQAFSHLLKNSNSRGNIQFVLLNACHTEPLVDLVVEHIPFAIGMSKEILDKAAYWFAVGFYKALVREQPIESCYEWACNSVEINMPNVKLVTESGGQFRKLIAIAENETEIESEPLKIILKQKPALDFVPQTFAPETPIPEIEPEAKAIPPDIEEELKLEQAIKDYQDLTRNAIDNLGNNPRDLVTREPISKTEYRQRLTLLNKVKEFWIDGFLKPSLYADNAIDLELESRPDAILRPVLQSEVLPIELDESFAELKRTDIYGQIGQGKTLLILGEPGSGKTITLLQLAEHLIVQTAEDLTKPILIVFNLSSWGQTQKPLEQWLIEEFKDKYQVPKFWSEQWLREEQLILLLDGLDEVQVNQRDACVRAINDFIISHNLTETIVCSRVKDYEALGEKLQLSSAICLKPLSSAQVYSFLDAVGDSLVGLKNLLRQDEELEQFAQTPLILNVMSLAYQGWSTQDLLQELRSTDNHYSHLFDNYIQRMLNRKVSRSTKFKYSKQKVVCWLSCLAKQMVKESKIIFLIEEIQPTWLRKNIQLAYLFGLITVFLSITIINSLLFGLDIYTSTFGSIISGLIFWTISDGYKIKVIDKFKWSLKKTLRLIPVSLLLSTCVGLIADFSYGLILTYFFLEAPFKSILDSFTYDFLTARIDLKIAAVFIFNILGLMFCLIRGIVDSEIDISKKTIPNQGIFRSVRYSLSIASLNLIIICSATILLNNVLINLDSDFYFPIYFWTTFGFFFGYAAGGGASVIKHFILRFSLYVNHKIPWNYARFLDYASKRLLMKRVGGGYVFYHRMLMEHFANMELEQ